MNGARVRVNTACLPSSPLCSPAPLASNARGWMELASASTLPASPLLPRARLLPLCPVLVACSPSLQCSCMDGAHVRVCAACLPSTPLCPPAPPSSARGWMELVSASTLLASPLLPRARLLPLSPALAACSPSFQCLWMDGALVRVYDACLPSSPPCPPAPPSSNARRMLPLPPTPADCLPASPPCPPAPPLSNATCLPPLFSSMPACSPLPLAPPTDANGAHRRRCGYGWSSWTWTELADSDADRRPRANRWPRAGAGDLDADQRSRDTNIPFLLFSHPSFILSPIFSHPCW